MAEENVQKLLDMLYEMIDEAKNAPLSNDKCVLNRDEALDLLDEIRAQMPVELKRAQELVRARDEYVEAAKRDVERMMQKAEFEAKSKVSESEVLTAARAKGHEIVTRAEERSREMYRVANDYSEDVLRRTEEAVQMALDEVKQTRVRFRAASNEQMQRRREELNKSLEKNDKEDKKKSLHVTKAFRAFFNLNIFCDEGKTRHKILWRAFSCPFDNKTCV